MATKTLRIIGLPQCLLGELWGKEDERARTSAGSVNDHHGRMNTLLAVLLPASRALPSFHLHKCNLWEEVRGMNFLVEIRVAYPRRRKEFATRGQQAIPLLQARCNRIPFGEVRYYPVPVDITDGDGRVVGVNAQIEEALKILQSGNRQDAERALETLQGVVYGFGMKVCGSHEDAQDTAQETLIRLARQLRDFPDARALSVWLYKVAKTQCLMSRRKSKFAPVQMPSLEDLLPKDADLLIQGGKSKQITPEDILLNQELRDRLQEAILALPKHYRLVLILRDMEQLDTREVAEVMGISEETTKMRLHRARVSVRNALAGYFQDLKEGEKRSHA